MASFIRRAVQRVVGASPTPVAPSAPAVLRARLASGSAEVAKSHDHSHDHAGHGHGTPLGAQPREPGLAYPHPDGKEPVGRVRDGGDIDWADVVLPTNSTQLFGPGSAPGNVPTDFEQATGRERYELMYRMAGLDPWHIGELQVPFLGTPEHPVFVWSSNPFRIVGCTGFPKDSHDRKYMRVRMGPIATRCGDCGAAYALDYVGPFRNEHGQLLALAPGSTPEDPKFVPADPHDDAFAADVDLDFKAVREGWHGAPSKRWKGWEKAECPADWELQHADEAQKTEALAIKEDDARPLAWWDFAKGSKWAKEATIDAPKRFWGSFLFQSSGHH